MCGIFGYISNDVKKIDVNAFKILGILNETRGESSCGVMVDSEIFHGVEYSNKKFRDFLKNITIEPALKPTLIGHTRKSSVGAVNIHNAHPFGFGTNKDNSGYEFIGVHNGTLYNYKELAEEFKVDIEINETENTKRQKIDSEVLLESIYQSKGLKPLSFYNGGAALCWYIPDTDTVCLFSGESKGYEYSQVTSIERPLHVWLIDDNTFAFSSEQEPLEVIGALKKDVFQIETNTVYIIKNGDFKNAKKLKISRNTNVNKREVISHHGGDYASRRLPGSRTIVPFEEGKDYTQTGAQKGNSQSKETNSGRTENLFGNISKPQEPKSLVESSYKIVYPENNVMVRFINENEYKNRYYFKDFRLMRNGHVVPDGIYISINHHGYFYVGSTIESATTLITKNKDSYFDIVEHRITDVETVNKDNSANKSSRYVKFHNSPNITDFTFIFKGYILETYADYMSTINTPEFYIKNHILNYNTISYITKYPVLCKSGHSGNYNRYVKNGELFSGSIHGKSFECTFKIESGFIKSQTEIYRYFLTGVNLQNKIKYEEALVKYYKEVEEYKQKNASLANFKTRTFLKEYAKKYSVCCDVSLLNSQESLNELAENAIALYEEYEDDCMAMRQDIGLDLFYASLNYDCSKYNLTLDEVVFDIVSLLEGRIIRNESLKADELLQNNLLRMVIKVLMNREKSYN